MTIPNDDALIAETRSGVTPGTPFGWDFAEEIRAITARLLAAGHPDDSTLYFTARREYERAHRDDLTYSQRQDLARWLGLGWAGGKAVSPPGFTADEIAYMLDRLAGTNDPDGQSAVAKLQAMAQRLK